MIPALAGKKKAVTVILSGLGNAEAGEDDMSTLEMICDDMCKAMADNNPKAVAYYLKAAVNAIEAEEDRKEDY